MRFLFAALLASFASAQTTWVVDDTPGPGVAFTSLPAAVAAAASGDTLLVAPGHYAPFHVSGKALTILGDGNVTTFIDGSPVAGPDYINITSPPVGTTFRLSGVTVRRDFSGGTATVPASRLGISGAGVSTAGTVVLTDVISEPTPGGLGVATGLGVTNIAVSASRCVFRGGWVGWTLGWGFPGVKVQSGRFVADACLMYGGSPYVVEGAPPSTRGGDGLGVSSATAHLTGCSLTGGSAGMTGWSVNGGAGLRVLSSTVQVYGSASNSIRGGNASGFSQAFGGPGIDAVGGAVSVFGAIAVSGGVGPSGSAPATTGTGQVQLGLPRRPVLSLTGSAPSGGDLLATQVVTLRLDAPAVASQLFVLFADLAPGWFVLPGLSAEPFLLTGSAASLYVGLLDSAGQFVVTFLPAQHTPGWINIPLHMQAFAFDPMLGTWLGSNAEVRRIR